MHKYKYTRRVPRTYEIDRDMPGLPGHHYGLVKRKDSLNPRSVTSYSLYCSCKWKAGDTWVPLRIIRWQWADHIEQVKAQYTLFPVVGYEGG